MVDVRFYERNIFTSYDMPAYIIVNSEQPFMIKAYEGNALYIDDTLTGNVRQAGIQVIKLWSQNPHGDPAVNKGVYEVTVEIYNSSSSLILSKKLKYWYDKTGYTITFKDEDFYDLSVDSTLIIVHDNSLFYIRYFGSTLSFPMINISDKFIIEAYRTKDNKKYMYFAVSPQIPSNALIQLSPNSGNSVTFDIDITQLNALSFIPGASIFLRFISWIGVDRIAYIVADWISRQFGIPNNIIDVRLDGNILHITYENDPIPILAIIIYLAELLAWVFVAYLLVNAYVSYTSYETQKLANEQSKQYYDTVNKITEYAQSNNLSPQDTQRLIQQVRPPVVSSTSADNTFTQFSNNIEQLKQMLLIAIGGAIVITVLSIAKK